MFAVIDRFEGDYAVVELENQSVINIERCNIPQGAAEGDVINIEDGRITINSEETIRRRAAIKKLTDDIWEK